MPYWNARTAAILPRNGTTTQTVPTPNGAATPAGAFLMVVAASSATMSTVASGWTKQLVATTSSELAVFVKTAAAAGEASLAITMAASNCPLIYDSFEFPSGTAYVNGLSTPNTSGGAAWSALTGTTGANEFYAAQSNDNTWAGGGDQRSIGSWGPPDVELTELNIPKDVGPTDGVTFSDASAEDLAVASWTPVGTLTVLDNGASDFQRIQLALNVSVSTPSRGAFRSPKVFNRTAVHHAASR